MKEIFNAVPNAHEMFFVDEGRMQGKIVKINQGEKI